MLSQPQNPKFRNNPENFHPCIYVLHIAYAFSKSSDEPAQIKQTCTHTWAFAAYKYKVGLHVSRAKI